MSASPDTGSPKRPNRRAVLLWLFPLMLVAFGMSWRQNQRRREQRDRLRRQQEADRQRRRREKEANE